MKEYQILVKTNSYAGNFEREMCAFMTGAIGECSVGSEFVDEEIQERFEDYISQRSDDHGCWRPVTCDGNNFIIFLEKPLKKSDLEFLNERAKLWEKERPYEYLDKGFKFKSLEQQEITTKVTKKKI